MSFVGSIVASGMHLAQVGWPVIIATIALFQKDIIHIVVYLYPLILSWAGKEMPPA